MFVKLLLLCMVVRFGLPGVVVVGALLADSWCANEIRDAESPDVDDLAAF